MKRYRGFLIDADNTIFDFDRSEREAFYQTIKQFGMVGSKTSTKLKEYHEIYKKINDKIWKELEEGKITWDKLQIERFKRFFASASIKENINGVSASDFAKNYLKNLSEKAYLIPYAREVLDYLSKRADLILGTNGITIVQKNRITISGIGVFFKGIIISEETGVSKPDPAFFKLAAKKLNLQPSEILVVGDSMTSDITGGNRAGFDTCLFVRNKTVNNGIEYLEKPTYIIHKLTELKGFSP